jgi:hypothetical protein
MDTQRAVTMTADDLVTGVLAELALRDWGEIDVTDRRLDRAFAEVYERLVASADPSVLDIDFQISPDMFHGDSAVVHEAITVAIQGRVVSRVNPTFRRLRINLSRERAERILSQLPGGRELYDRLAEDFISSFDDPS